MQPNITGTAGQRGPGVRGDAWVQVARAPDRPELRITSKVEALYGGAIRAQAAETLGMLGASDLSITIEDSGALPYVLMARIEAAVRRLRPQTGAALPARLDASRQGSARERPRRTRLYLPGNTPRYFINAGLYRADALILDLEDAVAPGEKDAARLMVRNALRAVNFHSSERMVRVNALPDGLDDVRACAPHGAQAFVLPKIVEAADVSAFAGLLDALERSGDVDYPIHLIPVIESAEGLFNARAIAGASPRVAALGLGLEDYTADIGAQRSAGGAESLWARSQIINAARAAGVQPLASVYTDVDDLAGFARWAREAAQSGFDGVACLHPRQVGPAHAALAPSAAEVERAQRIVAAFDAAVAGGQGVIAVDGRMVDAPVAARARRTLRLAHGAEMDGNA